MQNSCTVLQHEHKSLESQWEEMKQVQHLGSHATQIYPQEVGLCRCKHCNFNLLKVFNFGNSIFLTSLAAIFALLIKK